MGQKRPKMEHFGHPGRLVDIIFRFESGDFLLRRKIQFGYVLETFENYNKRKTLVGPQVIPRSLALPNEAKWLQKSDVLLWKT